MSAITRQVARALIWTPEQETLLIKVDLPWIPGGVWTLPRGGIEEGESPEHCLIREVFEETGLENALIDRKLWQCNIAFQFKEKARASLEQHYLVPTNKFKPDTSNMLDYELKMLMDYKWWTAEAIDIKYPLPLAYKPA